MAYDSILAKIYRKKNKEKIKIYREKNKERLNAARREDRKNNKEKIKQARDKYEEKNKERIKEGRKRRKESDPKVFKEKCREYSQRPEVIERELKRRQLKRDTDPIFRLNNSLSFGVRNSLKHKGISKNRRHWENLVGYTKEDLKEHIESLFQSGMSWGNYGKWQIDHIIPINFFEYKSTDDVEFKYCWSLYNLQPLWKKDNFSKNDKLFINGIEITSRLYRKVI